MAQLETKTTYLEERMVENEIGRKSNFAELVELRAEVRSIRAELEEYDTSKYREKGVSAVSVRSPFARRFAEPRMLTHAYGMLIF